MKRNLITVAVSFAATFAFLVLAGSVTAGPQVDSDGDGVQDGLDNCRTTDNSDQYDSNLDGRGNLCDPDLNQDNIVGIPDFLLWFPAFGLSEGTAGFSADADLNNDQVVGIPDFLLWFPSFGLGLDTSEARTTAPSAPDLDTSYP